MKPRFAFFAWVLLVAGCAPSAAAQEAREVPDSSEVPPPWELRHRGAGDPFWAPLLRLRDAEAAYQASERWRDAYVQLRAQAEAAAGNHAAALHFWDATGVPRGAAGELPEGGYAVDALDLLAAVADTARVVMVNERHHAASDRLLTLHLLPILYAKGFRYLAAEAFSHEDTTLNERTYPIEGRTGGYTDEPVFAEVVREALRLGYTLVPYEMRPEQRTVEDDLTPQQRRDRAQAQNLYDGTFRGDPGAKVLVHAGFSHVLEEASEGWHPMALYFRDIAGIDPVTVDQTRLSERSAPGHEHPAYRAAAAAGLLDGSPVVLFDAAGRTLAPAAFAVDLQVLTPRTTYAGGRPAWMRLGERRMPVDVAVPECRSRWCFVEARAAAEPAEAVALDRVEVTGAETVRLFLPPGVAVDVGVFAEDGALLGKSTHTAVPSPEGG